MNFMKFYEMLSYLLWHENTFDEIIHGLVIKVIYKQLWDSRWADAYVGVEQVVSHTQPSLLLQ